MHMNIYKFRKEIKDSIVNNRVCYFCMCFLFAVGIAAGIITVFSFDDQTTELIINVVNDVIIMAKNNKINISELLIYAVKCESAFFIMLMLVYLYKKLFPLFLGYFLIKGFCVGMSFGIVILCKWILSIPFVAKSIFIIICLLFMAIIIVRNNHSLNLKRNVFNVGNELAMSSKTFAAFFVVVAAANIVYLLFIKLLINIF